MIHCQGETADGNQCKASTEDPNAKIGWLCSRHSPSPTRRPHINAYYNPLDYFGFSRHPQIEEITDTLPTALGRWMLRSKGINALVYKKLPYNVIQDFTPVTQIGESGGYFVLVAPTLGINTTKELVALAKAKPLSYGSPPAGNTLHLATEMFKQRAGITLQHVPYKGGGETFTALITGEVHVLLIPPPAAMPFVKSGRLRALGFTGQSRLPAAPEVPTFSEAGINDMVVDFTWHGWFAPAKTPREIIQRLNNEARKALQTPKMRALMESVSFTPVANTPEEFRSFVHTEMKRYAEVVRAANVRAE